MQPKNDIGQQTTLRLILGDQLHLQHSWFATPDPRVVYLLMEVRQETDYVVHHIQKVAANPPIGVMYRGWDRMAAGDRRTLRDHAARLRGRLDEL